MDPDRQGEIGLLLPSGAKEEYVWDAGGPVGFLLVPPRPVIKVNVKLQQSNPAGLLMAHILQEESSI